MNSKRINYLVGVILIVGWSCDGLGSPLSRSTQPKAADLQFTAFQEPWMGGATYWPQPGQRLAIDITLRIVAPNMAPGMTPGPGMVPHPGMVPQPGMAPGNRPMTPGPPESGQGESDSFKLDP
ncbi:hypothetical protein HDE_13238 [Halotydeus destructor]|nr:hypothetical protein HDE_13238 [Halotydeus destructor]